MQQPKFQMSINVTCNEKIFLIHPNFGEKGNKFAEIQNLNLFGAWNSKILASVLIITCWKEMVKNKNHKRNYYLTKLPTARVNFEDFSMCSYPEPFTSDAFSPSPVYSSTRSLLHLSSIGKTQNYFNQKLFFKRKYML